MSTSKYHHGDLRNALLESVAELLREVGPSELSLRGVARRAGVSAMAPYRHFADKDALLAGVAARGFERLDAALRAATTAESEPAAALLAQGVAYVRFARSEPAVFRLMFGPFVASPVAAEGLRVAGFRAHAALSEAVAAYRPEASAAEIEDLALACWSIAHGFASLVLDGVACHGAGEAMIDEQAKRVLSVIIGIERR